MKWYKKSIKDLSDAEYDEFFFLMSSEKQGRVLKLKKTEDRKLAVCAEMLARLAISRYGGIAYEKIIFGVSEKGKPYAENADVFFNVSHSGEYAVCAADSAPVGIDIQKIVPFDEAVARRVCSEKELAEIEKSEDKGAEFTKIWTRKEAVLKMYGSGIFGRDIKNCIAGENVRSQKYGDYWISICAQNDFDIKKDGGII